MKSEFLLAFNEIAETRKLPREVVMDALGAALISAFKRDTGIPNTHHVEVRFDDKTGQPSIWTEKTVVFKVSEPTIEILYDDAREIDPDIKAGDTMLVESTPEGFGRIAAQTAKQVILQRMREAEREAQYQEYLERVGDLVTGTVQSKNKDVVTISLGRSEAILPRSQQMPNEDYHTHDKVRAYVMEVRKTNRGPQIVVSRTHRNMLYRLLELEVPEIYNGTVEIKSIAREPGGRSKVAVYSNQPGADPVGACVGMRGIRIQSIVRELNDERIDIIEWSPEQETFISKSLSPARVNTVFLDDDPDEGRTATVVVSDGQLSLAIGREGQNARLAAKLTGWRIDIKSITEAATEAYQNLLKEPELDHIAREYEDLVVEVGDIIERREAGGVVPAEDFDTMVRFVNLVEGYRLQLRDAAREGRREEITEARSKVPMQAYEVPLDFTDLPLSVYNILDSGGYRNVGEVMEQYYLDATEFETLEGFNEDVLASIETFIENFDLDEFTEDEAEVSEEPEAEPTDAPEAEAAPAAEEEEVAEPEAEEAEVPIAEATVEPAELVEEQEEEPAPEPEQAEDVIMEDELERQRRAEIVERLSLADLGLDMDAGFEAAVAAEEQAEAEEAEAEAAKAAAEAEAAKAEGDEARDDDDDYDDYGDDEDEDDLERRRNKRRRRQLVYDEDLGRVVAKRRRKGGRARDKWEDMTMDDLDEF